MGSPQQSKITLFFSGCKDNVNRGVFIAPPVKERKGWPGWGRHNTDQEHIKFLFHLCKYISTLTILDHHPHSVLPVPVSIPVLPIYVVCCAPSHLLQMPSALASLFPIVQASFSFFSIAQRFSAFALAISHFSPSIFCPNLALAPTTS